MEDVRLVLEEIRNGVHYGWNGDHGPGDPQNVVWRDTFTDEPTAEEYDAGWVIVQANLASEAATDTRQAAAATDLDSLSGAIIRGQTFEELRETLALWYEVTYGR